MVLTNIEPSGLSPFPSAGPPTGTNADWRLADPSEPFASQIYGPLSPDIVQILQGPQAISGGN
jgi:hypothetical protein